MTSSTRACSRVTRRARPRASRSPRAARERRRSSATKVVLYFGAPSCRGDQAGARQMPDEMTRLLAGLVARRRQIVEMIAAEGQRARSMSDKRLIKSIARLRKALEKELSELDVLIGDQIRRIGRLGREKGSARFSAWRRKDNRPDPDRPHHAEDCAKQIPAEIATAPPVYCSVSNDPAMHPAVRSTRGNHDCPLKGRVFQRPVRHCLRATFRLMRERQSRFHSSHCRQLNFLSLCLASPAHDIALQAQLLP